MAWLGERELAFQTGGVFIGDSHFAVEVRCDKFEGVFFQLDTLGRKHWEKDIPLSCSFLEIQLQLVVKILWSFDPARLLGNPLGNPL